MRRNENNRGYLELTQEERNMVSVLTHYIVACKEKGEEQAVEYTTNDISKVFKLNRGSLSALKSNVTREVRRNIH
jgi:hypothetical protein